MKNFWLELKKNKKKDPILALAPLAGYTDSAFRLICKNFGADVVYSEMASVTALYYNSEKTLDLLEFHKKERPYVVQLFGSDPDHFIKAVKVIEKEIGPDGFDINFGCPVKKVLKQGAGAKLMSDLKLSRKIIENVLNSTNLPLSIKVRAECFSVGALEFIKNINDLPVSALMVHGRTLKQLFQGPINLDLIRELKDNFSGIVLANGGVNSFEEGREVVKISGADGVGIGRGALGRPWVFSGEHSSLDQLALKDIILKTAHEHLGLVKKNKGDAGLGEFKGHLAWYFKDFVGASILRTKIMNAKSFIDIEKSIKT